MLQLSDFNSNGHSRCYSGFSGLGISMEEVLARIEQGIDVARQEVGSQQYGTPVVALPPSAYDTFGTPGGFAGGIPTWVVVAGGLALILLLRK